MTKTTGPLLDSKLDAHLRDRLENFKGDARHLEAALGALIFGQVYGWKVLRLVHGGTAYAKYEGLLGVRFSDACPPDTALSRRSKAYAAVQAGVDFWSAVQGSVAGVRSSEILEG